MKGQVDDQLRALVEIWISRDYDGPPRSIAAWIDTAFDGHLVFSESLIKDLELESLAETEAILADGTKVALETFICFIDWFGERLAIQVIANEGRFPLLGTGLLVGRRLSIDYSAQELTLD